MEKLYQLLAVSTVLAFLYDHSYVRTSIGPRKSKTVYFVLMTVLICFGGFRGSYNDTWTYRDAYVYLVDPFPEVFETIDWNLGANPGFILVEAFLKTFDVEVHLFLMFFFIWTTLFYMHFLKKYASGLALSVYFFITMGSYTFNMAAMKQCMATGICLMAIPYVMERKWIKYVLLVAVASLFHPYALMYLIVPFLDFKPWGRGTYIMLAGIIIGGFLFQPMLGTIIDITSAIGEEYTTSTFTGKGVSGLRLVAVWSPILLSFMYRKVLFSDCKREERIFMHLTIVYAGILFVGLFGTALYFGRLSNYFSMMPVVMLPWMLKKIHRYNPKDGNFITILVIICYFVFFYFSNTVETQFATAYEALSAGEFLKILFEWMGGRGA